MADFIQKNDKFETLQTLKEIHWLSKLETTKKRQILKNLKKNCKKYYFKCL